MCLLFSVITDEPFDPWLMNLKFGFLVKSRCDVVTSRHLDQWSGWILTGRDYIYIYIYMSLFRNFQWDSNPTHASHIPLNVIMAQRPTNLMRHSLHQAFANETFEIWMSHSLHVSPLPKYCKVDVKKCYVFVIKNVNFKFGFSALLCDSFLILCAPCSKIDKWKGSLSMPSKWT